MNSGLLVVLGFLIFTQFQLPPADVREPFFQIITQEDPAFPPIGFQEAPSKRAFPHISSFSPGQNRGKWLDWSKPLESKNLSLSRLRMGIDKPIWLTNLIGSKDPLRLTWHSGTKETDSITLDLDLRPDWVLEHPLGLFVLAQGHLYKFQTQDAQSPWAMKECLVRRLDTSGATVSGHLTISPDGSIWMFLTGGPATFAAMDGVPVLVPKGATLWKVQPDGQSIDFFAQGTDGWMDQLIPASDGSLFVKITKVEAENKSRTSYRRLAPGDFVKTNPQLIPKATEIPLGTRELILSQPGKVDQPPKFLLIQANALSGQIQAQNLDLENQHLYPTGDKRTLAKGLNDPRLNLNNDGSIAVFASFSKPLTRELPLFFVGEITSETAKNGASDPLTSNNSLTKMGPAQLAKMITSNFSAEAWAGWAEGRNRIQKSLNNPNSAPLPLIGELRKLAKTEDLEIGSYAKIISLLELSSDPESVELIQTLGENGTVPVRIQSLESLGRISRPGDQAAFQTLLNGFADPEASVKAASACSLAKVGFPGSANALVTALSFENDPQNEWSAALRYNLRQLGQNGHDRVLQMAQSGNGGDLNKSVQYFSETAEKPAATFILQLLDYPHLSTKQQILLIKALKIEGDPKLGGEIWKKIRSQTEQDQEVLRGFWEKLEETPLRSSLEARDYLIRLLSGSNDDKKWFALAKLKSQPFPQTGEILEKQRDRYGLSDAQKRFLDEAISYQKKNQEKRP